MVVNYPSMSSVDFGDPDFCFLISEPCQAGRADESQFWSKHRYHNRQALRNQWGWGKADFGQGKGCNVEVECNYAASVPVSWAHVHAGSTPATRAILLY